MPNFSNIEISISGRKILCQNASLDENTSLVPIYSLGYNGIIGTSPNAGLKHSVSLEYTQETNNDPCFDLIKLIRNYDFNSFPTRLVLGGITGAAYLNSYSLDIQPHTPVKVNSQFDIYTDLSGNLSVQPNSNIAQYNLSNASGISHYHSVIAKSNNGNTTGNIISLNYSFQANFQPIYKIGNKNPAEVKFLNGQENFNFISEQERRITITGDSFGQKFDFDIIEINPLSSTWGINTTPLILYPSSGKIISNKISVSEDNLILSEASIIKYY